jgi:hypothetical protein
VSAATWYVIDLRYDLRNNPNLADWRIDGVAQTQVSRAAAAATATGFGLGSTTNASIYSANYDDMFVANAATAYPVGDGKVVRLVPDGVGTHNTPGNFSNNDGSAINANSWQRLDEIPLGSGSDWVRQTANSVTSYLEFTFGNTTETCIREVSAVLAFHSATNAVNNAKTSTFDGSTESVVFSGDMGGTALQYASTIATPTSAPWSQSTVNGLAARVGFATDTNPNPYWDGLVLEAAVA